MNYRNLMTKVMETGTGGELVQSDPDHVADSTAGEAHLSEGARISSVPGLS